MELELLKSTPIIPGHDRSFNRLTPGLDLLASIEKLKNTQSWLQGELNAAILLKKPDKQIVLTVLHEGTKIIFFQSNDAFTIQIIEGQLMFYAQNESGILHKDQILTFQEKTKYNLTARQETVFLLTILTGSIFPAEN
jgi:hypothetical protein